MKYITQYTRFINIVLIIKYIYLPKKLILIRNSFMRYLLLFILIFQILSKNNYQKMLLSNSYEVTLKIRGTGLTTVLNSNFRCPSRALINNAVVEQCHCNHVTPNSYGSKIKLVWNGPISSTRQMFSSCVEITEIDLTNFDTSDVTDMGGMFESLTYLTSLVISNLNTKKVKLMDNMFYNCNGLSSINLASFETSLVTSFKYMFYGCSSLKSINLINFETENVDDIDSMFYNNNALTSIDLSSFNTQSLTKMNNLFYGCSKLEYINIKNFKETKNPTISTMFNGVVKNAVVCLDFPNLSQNIYNLAKNEISCFIFSCKSYWKSIQKLVSSNECICPQNTLNYNNGCYLCDINNCKSCGIDMNMPMGTKCTSCYDNKYLNKGYCVDNCKYGYYEDETDSTIKICKCEEEKKCKLCSNESLSQNNLCISCNDNYYPILNPENNRSDFIDCGNGVIDYYYFDNNDKNYKPCYSSCKTCDKEGNDTIHNCDTCKDGYEFKKSLDNYYNCYPICGNYYYFDKKGIYNCHIISECPTEYNKLITQRGQCIDDCSKDSEYKYEFKHTCYKECPYNISEKSTIKDFFCEIKCQKDYIFIIREKHDCVNECTIEEILNRFCEINYDPVDDDDNKKKEEKIIEIIKKGLTTNYDISDVEKGENLVIKLKYSNIILSTTENQKNERESNTSTIDLSECENKLKGEFNISKNNSLYILKIDVKQEKIKIPKIEYELYYPLYNNSLTKLNLEICKDTRANLYIPVVINEDLDKINKNSDYYNDICYTTTSPDGTDISLLDRKKEFVNNDLTVCEEDCDFKDYNYTSEKAICSCKIKTNSTAKILGITIDKDKLYNSFTDVKNIANIKVLNCYHLIFNLGAYKNNYANLILLAVIFLYFVSFIIFCCKDYFDLKKIFNMIIILKLNSKYVQKIVNKKKNGKKTKKVNFNNIQNKKSKKNKNIFHKNKNSNTRMKSKTQPKKQRQPSKFSRPTKFTSPLIKRILKSNPTKKENKEAKKKVVINVLNNNVNKIKKSNIISHNTSILSSKIKLNDEYNIKKFTEDQIYEMYLKINGMNIMEINNLTYKSALKSDKRTYCTYYISLLRTKHLIFFSFVPLFDYNSQILKIFLFFFNFTVTFIVNALFFNDDTMHKIYSDKGTFNIIYNIPQILYSALISGFINAIVKTLSLSEINFIELKKENNKNYIIAKSKKVSLVIKIKFALFFIICFILLTAFWFYLACFCAVYKNTQIYLIKDTVISFGTSMIYPFGLYLIPGIFRMPSLKKKDRSFMYSFSKMIQFI